MADVYRQLQLNGKPADWLMPVLAQLHQRRSEQPRDEASSAHFGSMIQVILHDIARVTEPELMLLAEHVSFLQEHHCRNGAGKLSAFAWQLQRSTGLSAEAVVSIKRALGHLPWPGTNREALYRLGWTLFRADNNLDDGDPCWSAAVRRDLRAMPEASRKCWLAVLDENHHLFDGRERGMSARLRQALGRLGQVRLDDGLTRWTQMLAETRPLKLSHTGVTLLRHLIRLAEAASDRTRDEALYAIACSSWQSGDDCAWVNEFLRALAGRSDACAFACLEALMMNPVASGLDGVERLYNGYLSLFAVEAAPAVAEIGVDGFPLQDNAALVAEHLRIDQLLRACTTEPGRTGTDVLRPMREAILRASGADTSPLILAIGDRVRWLIPWLADDKAHVLQPWRMELGRLFDSAVRAPGELDVRTLVRALGTDQVLACGTSTASLLLERCGQHIAQHGWHADLVRMMRAWVNSLSRVRGRSALRRSALSLLWLEDQEPVDPAACWSSQVRMSLRRMTAEERQAWVELLAAAKPVRGKPSTRWLSFVRTAFAKLGCDRFSRRIMVWFTPFRSPKPQRLSAPGSDVLRLLALCTLLTDHPVVEEALLWFQQGHWETGRCLARAASANRIISSVLAAKRAKRAIAHQRGLPAGANSQVSSAGRPPRDPAQ